jgi:acyl-CoA dehydrogenase
MPLLYDQGQLAIAEGARRVLSASDGTAAQLKLLEQTGGVEPDYNRICVDQGWFGIGIPDTDGGVGLGLVELGLVALSVGARLAGSPFLTANLGLVRALIAHGTSSQRDTWLPKLATGEARGATGICEGQSVVPASSRLRFENGRLTGTKPAVAGGGLADVALLLAADAAGPALVLSSLEGVERRLIAGYDNSRVLADLVFNGTPAEILVQGDAACAAALDVLAAQAVVTAHEQTGGAEALMLKARDYANTRRAFGQPIGAFQSVKHRIAELYGLVELARANALQAAILDGKPGFLRAAAVARISATEAYDTAARDCMQVHGGIGVTWESGLHLHMRRARTLANEQGNILFWEDLLVDQLRNAA